MINSLISRYLGKCYIWKYKKMEWGSWIQVQLYNERYGARLVLSKNILLVVGGGPDKVVR